MPDQYDGRDQLVDRSLVGARIRHFAAAASGVDEGLYIGRETVLYQCGNFPQTQHFSMDYTISCYNPEWVSIDVMGCNFVITNGSIIHDCVLGTEKASWGSR